MEKEKIIDLACFNKAEDAYILMTLLESEGIKCYLRNDLTSRLFLEVAHIEILEKDLNKALQIMEEHQYGLQYLTQNSKNDPNNRDSNFPFLKKFPLEKQILIMTGIIIIAFILLLGLGVFISK